MKHKSVLLDEVIDYLNVNQGGKYIDATVGYAGHSGEVLKRLDKKGFLFAFDQDSKAIEYSQKKLSSIGNNFEIINSNFVNISFPTKKLIISSPIYGKYKFPFPLNTPSLNCPLKIVPFINSYFPSCNSPFKISPV